MDISLDEIGERLHGKIDSAIDGLKAAKTHLENVQKETEQAIQTKLAAAKENLEGKRQEIVAARASLEGLIKDKKAETEAAVAEWKAQHDRKKLEKRAERAEHYADACVEIALSAVVDAEIAILEAAAARKDADNSKT